METLISLVVMLIVIGLLLWLVSSLPIDPKIKQIIQCDRGGRGDHLAFVRAGSDGAVSVEAMKTISESLSECPEPCLVMFCHNYCPILPEGSEVRRGSGDSLCDCGRPIREHPTFAYPSGMRHVFRGCDGIFYHT